MRSYRLLRELVVDCGATLVEEHPATKPDSCAYAVFVGRTETLFRLCWDKKERYGGLQVLEADGLWTDLGLGVRKSKTLPYTHLHAFVVTAERLAGTRNA
jgi:hypothetical protein